ncbi:MAG: hypothetical protein ACU0CA_13590 [Paracoccaceae bacterium]
MSVQRPSLIKVTCFALSLTGAAAVLATATMPDFAYAKNSKSNSASLSSQGGGSKSSKSQGGGSKSSKSRGGSSKSSTSKRSGSKSTKSRDSVTRSSKSQASKLKDSFFSAFKSKSSKSVKAVRQTEVATTKKIKTKRIIGGAHPSALGALNAAHANEQALLHASPNSRVGRIATYRDLVVEGKPLFDDLEDALVALEDIDARFDEDNNVISPEAIYVERYDATTEMVKDTDQQEVFEDLNAEFKDALQNGDLDEITAAQTALDDYYVAVGVENEGIATLNDDHDAAIEYETALTDIDGLQELTDDQKLLETEALQAAANKPVTEEIEYAVKEILGLNGE